GVEARVQREQRDKACGGETRPARREAAGDPERGEGARAVPSAEVERRRALPALEQELGPRKAASREVGAHHLGQRPRLQVLALDARVELDAREPQPELDVLDRGGRIALRVEAAGGEEGLAADRAEAGPERRGRARALVVDVVVEQVAEARD